jgi:sulfofructose kinase
MTSRIRPCAEGTAPFDVVGFGFNTFDHVCVVDRHPGLDGKQRVREYVQQPGGQIPTALVALQRWGLRTAYVGPFGDDEGGRAQRASLAAEGVDLRGTRVRSDVGSQTSLILVDRITGERSVLWQRPDGLALRADELDRDLLTSGRALFMDADDLATARLAARWAREAGVVTVLDVDTPGPGIDALLADTDVLAVAREFAHRFTGCTDLGRAVRELAKAGPRLAIVTLGTGGALACADRALHHVPAVRVSVVDTTSAGDLFHAGVVYGLLHDWPLDRTLRFASAAAALECMALGGRAAIPPLDRIWNRLQVPEGR